MPERPYVRTGGGLAATSIELGKILAERGRAGFRARGTCMYPCVRPGDFLHIEARTVAEISVGDIAVFRKAGVLFGHRVICVDREARRPYIITRPDNSESEDAPTCDEDLLGVVSSVEREGRRLETSKKDYSLPERWYYGLTLRMHEGLPLLKARYLGALLPLQRTLLYRKLAGPLFGASVRDLSAMVQIPLLSGSPDALYRSLVPSETGDDFLSADAPAEWRLALSRTRDSSPVASVSFVSRPEGCPSAGWWISSLRVRPRYRGLSLEERLMKEAASIFSRCGGASISVSLPDKGDQGLFESLGFSSRPPVLDGCPAMSVDIPAAPGHTIIS